MNKRKYPTIVCCLFLILGAWHHRAQSQPIGSKSDLINLLEIGRDNPFAEISKKITAVPQPTSKPAQAMPIEERPDLFVETVTLKFLDAESLKLAVENMCSFYGGIATNKKTNSLIVCDTKENLAKIVVEIKKADKKPEQIMIEVVILDVQLDDETEIGINWDILSDENYDIGYRQNFTTSRLYSTIANEATVGDATAFVTRGLGGDFSVISATIRNVVHMLQQEKEVEILASPRVMMVSGQSALIQAVEELPYTEVIDTAMGGASALTSTEFKEVGVQLKVSATLTDDNDIFLTVDAEQNVAVGESDTEVPIVDTRRANSSLLLKDGQVVILGGLRRQETTKEVDKIPLIADLPIIGELFKSTKNIVKNSELILFISPHIYKGEPIPKEAMAKFEEIKNRPMLSLQKQRDAKKKTLLEKIKMLQDKKDTDTTKELLSTLSSLEKILSQEVKTTLATQEQD